MVCADAGLGHAAGYRPPLRAVSDFAKIALSSGQAGRPSSSPGPESAFVARLRIIILLLINDLIRLGRISWMIAPTDSTSWRSR